jgi:uncharacterized LabA/DUF88 family protein
MERVCVYVDGFNFYYGIKRQKKIDADWQRFYWIDFVKLFNYFLGSNQVLSKVIYFTAHPLNDNKRIRQEALFNANKLLNGDKFEIIKGKYADRQIICPRCDYPINKPEEKRTDVNIAVRMIEDCILDNVDLIILVSADSDLVPPLEFIQKHFSNKKIKVHFPPTLKSSYIKSNIAIHKSKIIELQNNKNKFNNSVMSDIVSVGNKTYTIPEKWKLKN